LCIECRTWLCNLHMGTVNLDTSCSESRVEPDSWKAEAIGFQGLCSGFWASELKRVGRHGSGRCSRWVRFKVSHMTVARDRNRVCKSSGTHCNAGWSTTVTITSATMVPKSTRRRRVSGIGEEDTFARLYRGIQDIQATVDHATVVQGQPPSPGADIAQRTTALIELTRTKMEGTGVCICCLFISSFFCLLEAYRSDIDVSDLEADFECPATHH